MGNSVELMKKGDRSLLLVTWEYGKKEFVVCSGYDATKEFGSQWYWGHYFGDNLIAAVDYIKEVK